MAKRAFFDDIRSLAFGSISGTYAAVGTPTEYPTRGICITNLTAGIMIFSYDNTSVAGKVIVPAGSFKLWDIQSNMNTQFDDACMLPVGLQWYVKQSTAPVSGSVYIELLYAL